MRTAAWSGLAVVVGLCLAAWLAAREQVEERAAIRVAPESARRAVKAEPVAVAAPSRPAATHAEAPRDAQAPAESEQPRNDYAAVSLRQRIAQTDQSNPVSLRSALQTLAREPRAVVAAALVGALAEDRATRETAIWLAARTNGPELLSFWDGLLTRATPLAADEATRLPTARDEVTRAITSEQLAAIDALGALLPVADEAGETLRAIAEGRREVPGARDLLRLAAARQLQAHDPNALLKLARALPAGDPLRRSLAAHANAGRGE